MGLLITRRSFFQFLLLAAGRRKKAKMIRYSSESPSLILRARQILLVQIADVNAPDWDVAVTRVAEIGLRVQEVLKGNVRVREGARVVISVTQIRPQPGGFILPPRGCWPEQRLQTGLQFVVFANSFSDAPAEVLAESACLRLMPAENSLPDVFLAKAAETESLGLKAIVVRVKPSAHQLHELFIEYLDARLPELQAESRDNFEALLQFLTDRQLASEARAALLNSVRTFATMSSQTKDWHIARLAIAMLRLVAMPEAEQLHENLIETYLPNLLGLTGGARRRSAGEVFRDAPSERSAAERGVAAYSGPASTAALLAWIRE